MAPIPVIIVAVIILLLVVWLGFSMLRDLFSMLLNIPVIQERKFTPEVLAGYEMILGRFAYYRQLSPEGKQKFLRRTIKFMINKQFIGRQGLTVTDEMKVLISAAAVQLTFGLKKYVLPGLQRIAIYPDIFEFTLTGQRMKGGTTTNAGMLLSWKHFKEGFAVPDDRFNLGLHEMAHALKLHADNDLGIDEEVMGHLQEWEAKGAGEFLHLHNGETSILRKYGGTNAQEFFAVCTEHFSERPAEFKNKLPELYLALCEVYQQDPLNTIGDYAFENGEATANSSLRYYRDYTKAGWHWSWGLMLFGLIVSWPLLLLMAPTIPGAPPHLFLLLTFFVTFCNFISWPFFRARKIMPMGLFLVYSFFGVGVTTVLLVVVLNYSLPSGLFWSHAYETFRLK